MKKLLIIGALLAVSGCSTTPVRIHNYRRVAILDSSTSDDGKQPGDKLTGQMITGITNRKYYKVIERERVRDLLDERQYHSLKEGDKESILKTGRMLGVDAIIFANIDSYSVEQYEGEDQVKAQLREETTSRREGTTRRVLIKESPQKKSSSKEKKKRKEIEAGKSGTKIIMEKEKSDEGESSESNKTTEEETETSTESGKSETTKEVFVSRSHLAKKGYVSGNMRMVDVISGEIIKSGSNNSSVIYIATTTRQALMMPSDEWILDTLTGNLAQNFSYSVSPGRIGAQRILHRGKDDTTKLGVQYAKQGLWIEAKEAWKRALSANPGNGYALNNMGVAKEREQQMENAIENYRKALSLKPGEKVFMRNLSSARKLQESSR